MPFKTLMKFFGFISLALAIVPPLITKGRNLVDQQGEYVHLHCTAWSGAHQRDYVPYGLENQPVSFLIGKIKEAGFNCVRFQFSAELLRKNPMIGDELLLANPSLRGKTAMQIFDELVAEMSKAQLLVVLDYHMIDAGVCCSPLDQNGGWFNDRYTKQETKQYMLDMVSRYTNNTWVVGLDVRNEVRPMFEFFDLFGQQFPNPLSVFLPRWGRGGEWDWAAAAEEFGNAALDVDPKLLIIIQGFYQIQLDEVWFWLKNEKPECRRPRIPQVIKKEMIDRRPIQLKVPNRLMYSCHTYDFFYNFDIANLTYEEFKRKTDLYWGDVADVDVPFYLGEFGVPSDERGISSDFWQYLIRYIKEKKVHWAYWALEGTYAGPNSANCAVNADPNLGGGTRLTHNSYGLLTTDYSQFNYLPQIQDLRSIMFTNTTL
jgi:hypothetical protein